MRLLAALARRTNLMLGPSPADDSWGGMQNHWRFSVEKYHRLFREGIFQPDEPIELLEGLCILKLAPTPLHNIVVQRIWKQFVERVPRGWELRLQLPLTLGDSEPEPDLAIIRGNESRQPTCGAPGLLVEVAETLLDRDRIDKARIYARNGIPIYWIVNLVDNHVEVFTSPFGPGPAPAYAQRQDFAAGADVPLILDGVQVASIPVSELLP
jgi:Uma2 family endonuclease